MVKYSIPVILFLSVSAAAMYGAYTISVSMARNKPAVIISTDTVGELQATQQCINGRVYEYVQNQQLLAVYKPGMRGPVLCSGRDVL